MSHCSSVHLPNPYSAILPPGDAEFLLAKSLQVFKYNCKLIVINIQVSDTDHEAK